MATVLETPPLCAGDRLSREEFMRRWENEPGIKFAELLAGVVYMPSPLSIQHGEMDSLVGGWLFLYQAFTPGTMLANNATTFLLDDTPQPDMSFRLLPDFGSASWVEGDYLHGPPELVVEICKTSAAYDLRVKYDLYRHAKVPEYLAIILDEHEIRWHHLVDGEYQVLPPHADGSWRSRVFPGLWLDGPALFDRQSVRLIAKIQEGVASAEHAAFIEELRRRRLNAENAARP